MKEMKWIKERDMKSSKRKRDKRRHEKGLELWTNACKGGIGELK